jgi:hypothetical protein
VLARLESISKSDNLSRSNPRLGLELFALQIFGLGLDVKPTLDVTRHRAKRTRGARSTRRHCGAEQPDQLQVQGRDEETRNAFEGHAPRKQTAAPCQEPSLTVLKTERFSSEKSVRIFSECSS